MHLVANSELVDVRLCGKCAERQRPSVGSTGPLTWTCYFWNPLAPFQPPTPHTSLSTAQATVVHGVEECGHGRRKQKTQQRTEEEAEVNEGNEGGRAAVENGGAPTGGPSGCLRTRLSATYIQPLTVECGGRVCRRLAGGLACVCRCLADVKCNFFFALVFSICAPHGH